MPIENYACACALIMLAKYSMRPFTYQRVLLAHAGYLASVVVPPHAPVA